MPTYLVLDGASAGPFTVEQIHDLRSQGKITKETLCFREGDSGWQPIAHIFPELFSTPPATDFGAVPPARAVGFWHRFAALIIDFLILTAVGYGLGYFLFDTFVAMGEWGKLAGFAIAGVYFGILNSRAAGSRTVGKMLLGLKVVDANGAGLSMGKSFLRYGVWGITYFLNNPIANVGWIFTSAGLAYGVFLAISLFALAYLLIFNRRTRQSVHDIFTHTFVIRASSGQVPPGPVWQGHFIIIGVWSLIVMFLALITLVVAQTPLARSIIIPQERVSALPGVVAVAFKRGTTHAAAPSTDSRIIHTLSITVNYYQPVSDVEQKAREVATAALIQPNNIGNATYVTVYLGGFYDIGLSHGARYKGVTKSLKDWQQELGLPAK